MKMKNSGFTLVELMIVLAAVGIVTVLVSNIFLNNKGDTQRRAYAALDTYLAANEITVDRKTCSGDSDYDGYGSCTVVTTEGEKIQLQCESGWFNTEVTGATGCKESDFRVDADTHRGF